MTEEGRKEGPRPVRRVIVRQEEPPQPKPPEGDLFDSIAARLAIDPEVKIVEDTRDTGGWVYDEESQTAVNIRVVYIVPRILQILEELEPRVNGLNKFTGEVGRDLREFFHLGDRLQERPATGEEGRGVQTGSLLIVDNPMIFQEKVLSSGLKVVEGVPQLSGEPVAGKRMVRAMFVSVFPNEELCRTIRGLS